MTLLLATPGITETLVIAAFTVVITFFLCRWIFRVDTIADNLKAQTELLKQIAKYNNVPVEEINKTLGLDKVKYPDVGPLQPIDQQMK